MLSFHLAARPRSFSGRGGKAAAVNNVNGSLQNLDVLRWVCVYLPSHLPPLSIRFESIGWEREAEGMTFPFRK